MTFGHLSFEQIQLFIARAGVLVFEVAGLLGIVIYLVKRLIKEIRD